MSVGTAFHPRTAALNRKMQWREWAGYFASSVYADFHDIEYNAIREAAAVIDVSPLYKYRVAGPDAHPPGGPRHHPRRDADAGRAGRLHALVRRARQGHRRRHRRTRGRAGAPLDRRRPPVPLAHAQRRRPRRRDRGRLGVAGRAGPPGPVQPRRPRGRDRRVLRGPPLLPPPGEPGSAAWRSTSAARATRATWATSCGSRPGPRRTSGTRSSRPARRTRSDPPACTPSTSRASRPG